MKQAKSILIIGGGMAGLCAAIEGARQNPEAEISILDANTKPGQKIYATGNGRCNLANTADAAEYYRTGDGHTKMPFYTEGWSAETVSFMRSVGVLTHRRNGYIYPRTDQASCVALALEKEALRCGVQIRSRVKVSACSCLKKGAEGFLVTAMDGGNEIELHTDSIILATGGMVSPAYNCRGDGFRIAERLGHTVVPPVPALCALYSDDPFIKMTSGIRTSAKVTLVRGEGEVCASDSGEIQMTDTGISGIPVFQVSRYMEKGYRDRRNVSCTKHNDGEGHADTSADGSWYAVIDFIPELSNEEWEKECSDRIARVRYSETLGDFCLGLVPDKTASWLLAGIGLVREKKIGNIGSGDAKIISETLRSILNVCRAKRISITGTAGFEKAQATAGGIALSEVKDTMESKLVPGLYFAGEVLDVDGICGGYNLTWALHSGRLAGRNAAKCSS